MVETDPIPSPEPKQRLVISGTGDVNLDPTFVRSFPTTGYEYAWSGLDGLFVRVQLHPCVPFGRQNLAPIAAVGPDEAPNPTPKGCPRTAPVG
jgi:hypothetical protein